MSTIHEQLQPDEFFTAKQQKQLGKLMTQWRVARDAEQTLPTEEQKELEELIDAELAGTAKRAERLMEERCIR